MEDKRIKVPPGAYKRGRGSGDGSTPVQCCPKGAEQYPPGTFFHAFDWQLDHLSLRSAFPPPHLFLRERWLEDVAVRWNNSPTAFLVGLTNQLPTIPWSVMASFPCLARGLVVRKDQQMARGVVR